MIKSSNKTWKKMNEKPTPNDKIPINDVHKLLLKCGFKQRNGQGGSHRKYKLEGVPNSFIQLSGHGRNPKIPFYQVINVVELLQSLDLIDYDD